MGNCGRKSKPNVSTDAISVQQGGNQQNSIMKCPHCNLIFTSETALTNFNSHIQACANPIGTIDLNNSFSSTTANKPRISENTAPNPNVKKSNEPFVWVKKKTSANKYVWSKQTTKLIDDNSSAKTANMSIEEISLLNFEEKRLWLRNGLELLRIPWMHGADYVRVDKASLLGSSVGAFEKCNLFKEVKIEFKGDEKVNDAGGLMREWMSLVIKELVKPEIGLFVKSDCEEVIYVVNPKSSDSQETLKLYEFAGRIVGKAMFERITLDIHFDDCLLKTIAGKQIALDDIKSVDAPLYNSLVFLQMNTISGSDVFEEYFVLPERGDKALELCPKGAQRKVTDENKNQYIKLLVEWYGKRRIEKKVQAFIKGVSECIPIETLSVFEPRELEMIINGVPFIDVDDWENNANYKGSFYKTHNVIKWFWKILHQMSQEDLAKLLQFCTGSSRTPVEGFRALESNRGTMTKFCVESIKYEKGHSLITAHTCFNRLVLPLYPTEELLRKDLNFIIRSDFRGVFGLE